MGETKVIYHLDEQETPYLVKISVPADSVTLSDLKHALKKSSHKFFFKSMDADFGVVKEEITDDNAKLPCYNGRVVCWLVSADGSHSDGCSVAESQSERPPSGERPQGIGDSRPPSFHPKAAGSRHGVDDETETDSVVSHRRDRDRMRRKHSHEHSGARMNGYSRVGRGMELGGFDVCDSRSSLMSSELESSSCFDSDDDGSTSRFSSVTEQSGSSRMMRRHRRRRRKPKPHHMERSSSFSSITDSTMSLNIITVTLNMEKYNFLGISIVGQSNERGDGGIYIGSIMKGGAVAADGRIEPGDMLLQVNDINFENMCNDDAVRVLRDIVHKPGPVSLTVAKCWDPNPNNCFTPRSEPIRPIDPAAWVSHTAAMTGIYPPYGMSPSMSTVTSTSSSISSSIPETERFDDYHLSVHSDMATVAKAMACPDSGLEVRDRMWLKITIANAFIGSDVVDWLFHHVEGFADRREARKYASNLLKAGFIRHTVNKITFSEQCYYVFGDLSGNMAHLSLQEHDGSSGASDQDTLAPLLHPTEAPWPSFPYQYPPSLHDAPLHHAETGGGSHHSEGSSWSRTEGKTTAAAAAAGLLMNDVGDAPEFDLRRERAPSEGSIRSSRSHSHAYSGVSAPRHLAHVPSELSGSRRSCLTANGELFVDIM
ncbi:segment polarity protein dishevelled homolog DVL-3a [Clarias gariepinus]|uniref:segment polarity protein dishevelled homolog DVL-3a n=1 Tax=Clarias gariepinus TaxID=13013 RepID=UPI00234DDB59|nr:segment polarity protein dishevelled homolog DVL-3a [Clarias gariepinus]